MLIGTDRFRSVLEATRTLAGMESVRWAEVPHPIGSLDRAGLRDRARLAVDQFETIVIGGPGVSVDDT
jgi:hypothetical protein